MPPFIEKAVPDEGTLSELQPEFVKAGAPMEEMLELVRPNELRGFGGTSKKMSKLKELLHRFPEGFREIDLLWAQDALDKALILRQEQKKRSRIVPEPAGGVPSVGGPSASGMRSGVKISGGPTAGQLSESLPSPWAARASPPPKSETSSPSMILPVYPRLPTTNFSNFY